MNIVFDLGGVVFRWQPDAIIAETFEDGSTQDTVRKGIFEHPDWISLDRGTLSLANAIDRGAARTGLPARDIARLLHAVPGFLTPIEPTIELIRRLRKTANKLFVLSNMQLESIAHLERKYDIWHLFDGVVISARVRKVKPDIAIYQYLLETYGLSPTETVFIDDTPVNLEAASSLGIRTIRFSEANQCERVLADYGCL